MQIALLGIAIGANALSALAGGGAGLVQLPALILLGLPFSMALATTRWPVLRWGWERVGVIGVPAALT